MSSMITLVLNCRGRQLRVWIMASTTHIEKGGVNQDPALPLQQRAVRRTHSISPQPSWDWIHRSVIDDGDGKVGECRLRDAPTRVCGDPLLRFLIMSTCEHRLSWLGSLGLCGGQMQMPLLNTVVADRQAALVSSASAGWACLMIAVCNLLRPCTSKWCVKIRMQL